MNNQLMRWVSIQTVHRFIINISADLEIVSLNALRWNGFNGFVIVFISLRMQTLTSLHVHYHLFIKVVFICLVFKCKFVSLVYSNNQWSHRYMLCHRTATKKFFTIYVFYLHAIETMQIAVHYDHCSKQWLSDELCMCVAANLVILYLAYFLIWFAYQF